MKKTRKLVLSVVLLLISGVLVSTASYAWFSMNGNASVEGMQIDVRANGSYLLINTGENDTADEIQEARSISINLSVSDTESKIYPSKPIEASDVGGVDTPFLDGTVTASNRETVANPSCWYTANSNDPDSWKGTQLLNINKLNDTLGSAYNWNNYVIKRTVYLTVADGASPVHNLTVKPIITVKDGFGEADKSAIKILVATSDGGFKILDSSMNEEQDIKGSNTGITDTSVLAIDIYIYYDGSKDAVNTSNSAKLASAIIKLDFGITVIN